MVPEPLKPRIKLTGQRIFFILVLQALVCYFFGSQAGADDMRNCTCKMKVILQSQVAQWSSNMSMAAIYIPYVRLLQSRTLDVQSKSIDHGPVLAYYELSYIYTSTPTRRYLTFSTSA